MTRTTGSGRKWQIPNNGGADPQWSRSGHELVYRSGDQLMSVSYSVNGDAFVAEKPRVWMAALGATAWDFSPDGKRVAALIPAGSTQAPQPEHQIVMSRTSPTNCAGACRSASSTIPL